MAFRNYDDSDEPLTPTGRLFLQKDLAQVIHCAMGTKNDINVEAIKATARASTMLLHPRFRSLLVRDPRGVEYWRRTDIDMDRHFIVIDEPVRSVSSDVGSSDDDEAAVNEYLADMALSGSEFDETKPLWEIHVLKPHKCLILRIHHALGDGMSIISMCLTMCRRVDDPDSLPTIPSPSLIGKLRETRAKSSWCQVFAKLMQTVWFTVVYVLGFVIRSLWVRDPESPISGGDGVELWPRKLATARFRLDDMKFVKRAVPGATVNDVLFGVISSGLSKYLDRKFPGSIPHGTQITGLAMVNLREQPQIQNLMTENPKIRWGNQFGSIILPVYYRGTVINPLDHVSKAKEMLDRKKMSFEAVFSYWIGDLLMSWFGMEATIRLNKRIMCNSTFMVSNIMGPQDEVAFAGNPVTYFRGNVSSLPMALQMVLVSYAGKADLQILVAKDIIPDPEFLAGCFEGALMDMKAAAVGAGCDSGNNKEE